VSEKSSEVVKCTLAATFERPKPHEVFENGQPLHITVAPPFEIEEGKIYDLVHAYYDMISPWASYLYEDGESTEMSAAKDTAIFGTPEYPVPVRRINIPSEIEESDFLTLREWIKEATEEVCGEESTKDWMLGELHVSEAEHDLSVLEGRLAVDSLTLFVKRGGKWRAEEVFGWED